MHRGKGTHGASDPQADLLPTLVDLLSPHTYQSGYLEVHSHHLCAKCLWPVHSHMPVTL
jgi:hypothetical protein